MTTKKQEEKQPLTVEQAVEHLARIAAHSRREMTLGVAYDPGHTTMGGTPVKRVLSIYPGFDWDAGTVFLDIGPKLFAPGPDQESLKEHLAKAQKTLGWIGVAIRSGLPAAAVLKAIKQHYDDYAKPVRAPKKEGA